MFEGLEQKLADGIIDEYDKKKKKKSKKKSKKKDKYENLSGDDLEEPEITEAEKQAILEELTSEFMQE